MLKKVVWSIIMLGMSAYVFWGPEGGGEEPTITPTSTIVMPTDTVEPTATASPTKKPTRTPTSSPTATLTISYTPTATNTPVPSVEPTTFTPTATVDEFLYIIQPSTPVYMRNFVHTAEACNWLGVAGQVFGPDEIPVTGLIVKVWGEPERRSNYSGGGHRNRGWFAIRSRQFRNNPWFGSGLYQREDEDPGIYHGWHTPFCAGEFRNQGELLQEPDPG